MADGYVQVITDGSGKKIDSSDLVRSDATEVYRQRIVIGSNTDPTQFVSVSGAGKLAIDADFSEVIIQLKRIALLLEILVDQPVSARDIK